MSMPLKLRFSANGWLFTRSLAPILCIAFLGLGGLHLWVSFLFQYKPWSAYTGLYIGNIVFGTGWILFSLSLCKKWGFWPLIPAGSFSRIPIDLFISFCLVLAIILIPIKKIGHYDIFLLAPSSLWNLAYILSLMTFLPIGEELFFRGFLYNALKTRARIPMAVTLQAILFSALHLGSLIQSIYYCLIGLALAFIYEKRKNLLSPILVHVGLNISVGWPILILAVLNFHAPAPDWESASVNPAWLMAAPSKRIEQKATAMEQYQYAKDRYGTKGAHWRKKEANAYYSICVRFPEDKTTCAKSKLGIVNVYATLGDSRRTVLEADKLCERFPDHEQECATALLQKGWAYIMLRDLENGRLSFEKVIRNYPEYTESVQNAQRKLKQLKYMK